MNEVFECSENVILVEGIRGALQALKAFDRCGSHLGCEVGVLGIHFLDAPVARISAQIENWSQHERVSQGPDFTSDR